VQVSKAADALVVIQRRNGGAHPIRGGLVRIAQGQERPLLAFKADALVQVQGGIRLVMGVGSRNAPDW
jgi:hypothetical protein